MPKQFFTIGKTPGYNYHINKKRDYNDRLISNLALVDLYPRTIKFNKNLNLSDYGQYIEQILTFVDENHPMKFFDQVMEKHRDYLDSYNPGRYDGIRLVATVDSAINNSISHNYGSNALDPSISGAKGMLQQLASKIHPVVGEASKKMTDISRIYDMLSGQQYSADRDVSAWIQAFSDYRVHLPKMWSGSSVSDILQLSVKLTSPSGDKKSVYRYIVEPMIVLFIMSSPLTVTGTDVSMPFIYEVDAHGIGHYKLAGITNVNFDRGGTDVVFSKYQQPLSVNVRLSLTPLAQDAVTALKDTDKVYKHAWFQTPETIMRSLSPDENAAKMLEKSDGYSKQ